MSDWRDDGKCRDGTHSPELWFPITQQHKGMSPAAQEQTEQAKAICRTCPVVAICAAWAMDTRQQHGVWGALSEADRARMWRAQGRVAARGQG